MEMKVKPLSRNSPTRSVLPIQAEQAGRVPPRAVSSHAVNMSQHSDPLEPVSWRPSDGRASRWPDRSRAPLSLSPALSPPLCASTCHFPLP
eukprot:SAG25_NODE_2938_length_1306_cov_2.202154_3_plen_90_part_01